MSYSKRSSEEDSPPPGSIPEWPARCAAARGKAAHCMLQSRSRTMTPLNILGELSLSFLSRFLINRKDVHSCLTRTSISPTKTRLSNS